MRTVLLAAAAAIATITSPSAVAQAQDSTSTGFHDGGFISGGFAGSDFSGAFPAVPRNQGWGIRGRPGFGFGDHHDGHDDGDNGHHRRHDRFVVDGFYGGEWALYNNRSWESDSYNDWWHDRPDRAYPAWMRHNQDCERIWWSGGGWRC